MEEGISHRGEPGHGSHLMAAVSGSGNSEYLIRWTESASRRFNAAWTALHVRNPGLEEDSTTVERNLSLAKELGAETISVVDTDIAACIVRYARIKKATALVIGKAEGGSQSFLGRRSIMEEILKESGDLDVIVLRGKTPVPQKRRRLKLRSGNDLVRSILFAVTGLSAVTTLGFLGQPVLGYRSISILYLLTIIALSFSSNRMVVFISAISSALLWNFLFIPPKLTFSIASLEDVLMFLAFFLAAFVGGFLTSRLKEKELALSLRERRMAFLYGFTRSISRVRGIQDVAGFTRDYLRDHLGLHAMVCLRNDAGELDTIEVPGDESESLSVYGFEAGNARRCLETRACVDDGDDRLYFPLGSQESMLGVLYVTGKGERTIRGESREILATLAGNMALALEREQLAAENERNKMAGETARLSRILLNHVSHELRTPLTTIKGSVSGLLDGNTAEDPGLREALLSETLIAANKLNVLVEDLLAMSRLESGRMSPHLELAYVSELIGAAQPALGTELVGRTILLDERARDSEIEVDPALMTQVFRNILRNFATYTAPGSILRVGVEYVPGFTEVRFSDDGPGVPEAELPLIFDTFYRGSLSAAKQGCGLGLSICRGIAEVHGGCIEANRSAEGGLLIMIRLPRKGGL